MNKKMVKDKNGDTVIHCAARDGNLEELDKLMKSGNVDVNEVNFVGYTPLHHAVKKNSLGMVRKLVNGYGASILVRDKYLNTPCHIAIFYGYLEIADFLCKSIGYKKVLYNKNSVGDSPFSLALKSKQKNVRDFAEIYKVRDEKKRDERWIEKCKRTWKKLVKKIIG